MTETNACIFTRNTFGGKIYLSDFDTEYCNGNIASRIFSDWKFDEECKKNSENKEWRKTCLDTK